MTHLVVILCVSEDMCLVNDLDVSETSKATN